ncbi:MAG TPA: succinate dehydrogenase, hydrophobic membrane anchor protein [Stellaceae bacterium]|jgi:succinate dehydrogenase / fumarate reductase membrane anchor subunit
MASSSTNPAAGRMRSPLGRALGLGSAKEGVEHWWMQRITSIALVPLSLWFVASVVALLGADYETFVAWIGSPVPAILMILLIIAAFYHSALGVRVVIEDYVHGEGWKTAALIVQNLIHFALGVAGVFAVMRVAFGG